MAKSGSYDSDWPVRPFAPEVSMAIVHTADLPAGSPDPALALERGSPDLAEPEDPAPVAALCRTSPGPIENATTSDTDDDLKPARGFMNATLLSVPLWGLLGLLTWLIVR
jgi:hypothetical protein